MTIKTKWADYLIDAVRYNDDHSRIVSVRAFPDDVDNLGLKKELARESVVNAIENGINFETITFGENSKWIRGHKVMVVEINKTKFIKTVRNNSENDNLENLPEF